MTKNKLLELYNKFKEKELCVSLIRQLRNCTDKEIDIITNHKYPLIMIEVILNNEFKLLSIDKQDEIINMINNAKNEEIAKCIFYIVRSGIILSSGLTIDIIKIILESNTKAVSYVTETALSNSVLVNPHVLELLTIIGSSKKAYQASCAANIAKNLGILSSEYLIELTKIASQTEGVEQCSLVEIIVQNRNVQLSGMAVKLTKIASNLNNETIEIIKKIASNKILERNNLSLYYLLRMFASKTYEDICNIYNEASEEIILLKQQESKIKNDNGLFWNVYKNNPSEAIELLINNTYEQVTLNTRIKKKTNNN